MTLTADIGQPLHDPLIYKRLIGKLNYLTNTRPDLAFSVQHLSQFMSAPQSSHMETAIHVLRYLKSNPNQGILMCIDSSFLLEAFCGSYWVACNQTRKAVSGCYKTLGQSPISWKSKK